MIHVIVVITYVRYRRLAIHIGRAVVGRSKRATGKQAEVLPEGVRTAPLRAIENEWTEVARKRRKKDHRRMDNKQQMSD